MKNLLIGLIGLLFFIGCGKSEEGDGGGGMVIKFGFMSHYDISPSDTSGLRIFGLAAVANDTIQLVLLGNKNGRLWIQLLKENLQSDSNNFKRITNFTVNADFKDSREIDLGYGNKVVEKVNYMRWDQFNDRESYRVCLHDYKHFSISKNELESASKLSWVICENEIIESQIYYKQTIANGYIGWMSGGEFSGIYVCDEKGFSLYGYHDKYAGSTFINIYECITYSDSKIVRQNAKTEEIVWEYNVGSFGQVIDGHKPQIKHTIEVTNNIASCTFNITNYDGSKETKNFKINIDTGEVVKL